MITWPIKQYAPSQPARVLGQSATRMRSLILGFGTAGRRLHIPCIYKARNHGDEGALWDDPIGVVEPREGLWRVEDRELRFFPSMADVCGFDPASTVVHVCTPPQTHLAAIQAAIEQGYHSFICEKPLVTSRGDMDTLQSLQAASTADILVVANWLHSNLTDSLVSLFDTLGQPRCITIVQDKPRFSRTSTGVTHGTVFDIEIPHQVALAIYLAGKVSFLIQAEASDMRIGQLRFPHMGRGHIELQHRSGTLTRISSDLTSPARRRTIELLFEDASVVGHFPIDASECYAHLDIFDQHRRITTSKIFPDDPLTECFRCFYEYFEQGGECPISNIEFNKQIVSVLNEAKHVCGINNNSSRQWINFRR